MLNNGLIIQFGGVLAYFSNAGAVAVNNVYFPITFTSGCYLVTISSGLFQGVDGTVTSVVAIYPNHFNGYCMIRNYTKSGTGNIAVYWIAVGY